MSPFGLRTVADLLQHVLPGSVGPSQGDERPGHVPSRAKSKLQSIDMANARLWTIARDLLGDQWQLLGVPRTQPYWPCAAHFHATRTSRRR
jgi:hypothetical protein